MVQKVNEKSVKDAKANFKEVVSEAKEWEFNVGELKQVTKIYNSLVKQIEESVYIPTSTPRTPAFTSEDMLNRDSESMIQAVAFSQDFASEEQGGCVSTSGDEADVEMKHSLNQKI